MRSISFGTRHLDQTHDGLTLGGSVQTFGVLLGPVLECARFSPAISMRLLTASIRSIRLVETMRLGPDLILKLGISGSQSGDEPAHNRKVPPAAPL